MVDKYSWVDIGSSYPMNDVSAAYLWGNLEKADDINQDRLATWQKYYDGLKEFEDKGLLELPTIPDDCVQNAHMFYLKVKDLEERTALLEYLKQHEIWAVFHYVPLHSAPAGLKFGRFDGEDRFTTAKSERLVRLPMYYGMSESENAQVVSSVKVFFDETK